MIPTKSQFDAVRASAQFTGEKLAKYCNNGNIVEFHEAFDDYLAKHSDVDPFGRVPLEFQLLERGISGTLSFWSNATHPSNAIDPEKLDSELKKRQQAWMSILPLDLQVVLLMMENSLPSTGRVDPATLKWDQWWDIQNSTDPQSTYASSPMHEVKDIIPPWEIRQDRLVSKVCLRATQLMHRKSWEDLAAWMAASRMHACKPIDSTNISYTNEKNRVRTYRVMTVEPLPFWTMGLFAGATEPEFWKVMHRFGGPKDPSEIFQERFAPGAKTQHVGKPGSCPSTCPPILQWDNPLSWLDPDEDIPPIALELIERTHATWMRDAMEAGVCPASTAVGRPAPRL